MAQDARDIKFGFWKGALFSTIISVAILSLSEIVLWLSGVETLIEAEDPFKGFSGLVSVFEADGSKYRTRRFTQSSPFNDQEFLATKPENGLRIFTLGGSSAYGHPWGADVAFTALVGESIAAIRTDLAVEAVNAAGVSYAMHRLNFVADEVLDYEPDILIIYGGHNEFVEPTFFAELKGHSSKRNRIELLAAHLRSYSLMHNLLRGGRTQNQSTESCFNMFVQRNESRAYDSKSKKQVMQRFATGLRRIVERMQSRGVQVLVATVPANLSRWRPNHSIVDESLDADARSNWVSVLSAGTSALNRDLYTDAVANFRKALQIAPRHAESNYLVAQAYEALGLWDEARKHYQLAADYDASPIRRTSAINQAIVDVANEEGAVLVDIESTFEKRSNHALIGFELIDDYVHPTREGHRIIAWQLLGAIAEAGWLGDLRHMPRDVFDRIALSRAPNSNPRTPTWFYNQGYMLAHQGQTQEAIAKFREAILLAPTFEPAMSNLAQLLVNEREDGQAIEVLERLLGQYPENARGHSIKGTVLARRGHDDRAMAEFRLAIELSPELVDPHLHVGTLLLKNGQIEEAEASFDRALALDSNNVDARLGQARAVYASGGRARAVVEYQNIIDTHPSSALAHHELAMLLDSMGERSEAIELLTAAAALASGSSDSVLAMGVIRLREGKLNEAESFMRQALRITPNALVAHNYLGLVLRSRGELGEAIAAFTDALRIDSESAEVHVNLGSTLSRTEDTASAVRHYRQAIRLNPDWPVPYNNLAWILATDADPGLRDPAEALILADKAVELMGPNASALDTLAAAQAASGQFAEAIGTAQAAHRLAVDAGADRQAAEILERLNGYIAALP